MYRLLIRLYHVFITICAAAEAMHLLVDVQCRLQKKIKNVYRRRAKGMLCPNSDLES